MDVAMPLLRRLRIVLPNIQAIGSKDTNTKHKMSPRKLSLPTLVTKLARSGWQYINRHMAVHTPSNGNPVLAEIAGYKRVFRVGEQERVPAVVQQMHNLLNWHKLGFRLRYRKSLHNHCW